MIKVIITTKIDITNTLHNIYYTHIYIHKLRLTEAHYSYK